MSGNKSISDKIAYPVIQALLVRVNALRNNGNIEQAVKECATFINGLEILANTGLPMANAAGLTDNIYNSPLESVVGAGIGTKLAQVNAQAHFGPQKHLETKETIEVANMGAVAINISSTGGIGLAVAAAYLYALYQGDAQSKNKYMEEAFYEHLLQTIKSVAVPVVTSAGAALISAIVAESKSLLLALEIEKDGITSIAESITKSNWPGPDQTRIDLAYEALKKYGNQNTAGILMYLHAKFKAFTAVEKMLPHTENISRNSQLLNNTDWAMESLAANWEEWDLVKKLLKIRAATNPISVELSKNLLRKAVQKNNIEIAEMLLEIAPNNDTDKKMVLLFLQKN